MKEIKLNLKIEEAKVLVQLLDIAVKAGGLNVAEAAIFFTKEIEKQLQESEPPQD